MSLVDGWYDVKLIWGQYKSKDDHECKLPPGYYSSLMKVRLELMWISA